MFEATLNRQIIDGVFISKQVFRDTYLKLKLFYAGKTIDTYYNTNTSVLTQVGASSWKTVVCAGVNAIGIDTLGRLWSWGYNNDGSFGVNDTYTHISPVQVGLETNWKSVSKQGLHTLAVKTDGTLWAWGNNAYGQLGDSTTVNRSSPVQVGSGTDWKQISAGGYHSAAVKQNGSLWTWGYNAYGNLGDNTVNPKLSPIQVGSGTDWDQVASGGQPFTIAIKTNGSIWTWGINSDGELGINAGPLSHKSSPVQIGTGTDWKQISAGEYHAAAIKQDGTLWSWGSGTYGELGYGSASRSSPVQHVLGGTNWSKVDCGTYNTAAIKTDGTLWTWGQNGYGQLVNPITIDGFNFPGQVGSDTTWIDISLTGNTLFALKL